MFECMKKAHNNNKNNKEYLWNSKLLLSFFVPKTEHSWFLKYERVVYYYSTREGYLFFVLGKYGVKVREGDRVLKLLESHPLPIWVNREAYSMVYFSKDLSFLLFHHLLGSASIRHEWIKFEDTLSRPYSSLLRVRIKYFSATERN